MWAFAAQHAVEIHRREAFKMPPCKFEFGQRILVKIKEAEWQFESGLRTATFLWCAPNATNGYFAMHPDGKIELTSNITEAPALDNSTQIDKECIPGRQWEHQPG